MSIERWAMIQDSTVINVCLWDGNTSTWQPPAGVEMQPAPDYVSIGWGYVNGVWVAPVPAPAPE